MKISKVLFFSFLLFGISLTNPSISLFAQDDKKGDLEDFTDDYGDEDDDDGDSGSDAAAEFFLAVFLDNFVDFVQLWGHKPGTEFGPYPSYPYAVGDGFMNPSDTFRSYFFNTEMSYHYLKDNLRSYNLKWETQFIRSSKLSFDLAVYDEELFNGRFGSYHDQMTLYGVRYGQALYRSEQMIWNIEFGFRGLHRRSSHGGPELALDMQLFPRKPFIMEMEVAAAYITDGMLYTVESSAGVILGRVEVLGGLRILKNHNLDMLDGFRVGLRIWY